MPRKYPLNQTDLAIARRLTELRKMHRLSREDLANLSTIGTGVITRIELGRMPLGYTVGKRILSGFSQDHPGDELSPFNPLWLSEGLEPMTVDWPLHLPALVDLGLDLDLTFSAFVSKYRDTLLCLIKTPPDPVLPEEWLGSYLGHWSHLWSRTEWWERAVDLVESVLTASSERLAPSSPAAAKVMDEFRARKSEKKDLTELNVSVKQFPMQSKMAVFINRLNRATSVRGKKSELAAYMDLPLASISQWLSGERQPSGEATLRLLEWVTAEEAQQKKSPGSALTPPEPKTLKGSHVDETPTGPSKRSPKTSHKSSNKFKG